MVMRTDAATAGVGSGAGLFERNLAALERSSARAAGAVRAAREPAGLELEIAPDGGLTGTLAGRRLASARRPVEEGERLAAQVDVREAAAVVVMGFGLGHHVAAVARRVRRSGLLIVFEPDAGLLRAALEREDHSGWMRECNLLVVTESDDASAITAPLRGMEAIIGMGMRVVDHAPSMARLGDRAQAFRATLSGVVRAIRTSVVTTMMQTEGSVRNALMNVEHYAGGAGIGELEGLFAGRPAVVVSAGPSLARNVRLLAAEGVRDRCVIVAVQTTLKPLLEAGVRPHFVTALDYHEISARFYENLRAADVRGVTLVAEPKANPAILDSWPGELRCPADHFLDLALGGLAGEHGAIPSGATVAHLAYYLARHLGCDPVALIGQDLGFTDGLYYGAGAAIHNTWAGELNDFTTLELLEWQRIARARGILRRAETADGEPVYTDEQMATYLAQFERDFAQDADAGRTTYDATEGGVRKAHTRAVTLAGFLERFAGPERPALAGVPPARPGRVGRAPAGARLREVRAGAARVADLSRRAAGLLDQMLEHRADQRRVAQLIDRVNAVRDDVQKLDPAYTIVQRYNQTGAFNRARADRSIHVDDGLTPLERQRRQIERDRENVRWLADAAESVGRLFDQAIGVVERGEAKRTRDPAQRDIDAPRARTDETPATAAVVLAPWRRGALGVARDLGAPLCGTPVLRRTLERLAQCARVQRAIVLTDEPERAAAVSAGVRGLEVEIERFEGAALGMRGEAVRAGRLWADRCWRGGLGGLTACDEALWPEAMAPALERRGLRGALVVGGDWALVDPSLCDALLERYGEDPDRRRLVFSQAPAGLCGFVVDRLVLEDLERSAARAGAFATFGGVLGYVPTRPRTDPIAQDVCVGVPPAVRDAMRRFVADSVAGRALLERVIDALPEGQRSAERIVRSAEGHRAPARLIEVELTTARTSGGRRARWAWGGDTRPARSDMPLGMMDEAVGPLLAARDDAVVSFCGAGDPLLREDLPQFVARARALGAAGVHVRTDLLADRGAIEAVLGAGPDVVSVDVLADRAATYEALTGADRFGEVVRAMELLLDRRSAWAAGPWVTARITRCEAAMREIEPFVDRWTLRCGWAVVDPAPAEAAERLGPLPLPASLRETWRSERVGVRSDGALSGGGLQRAEATDRAGGGRPGSR